MDNIVYPAMRKAKIRFTPLRRMCASFFVACAAMIWAAVIQYYIYTTTECGYYTNDCEVVSPLNVWSQTGAYVLVGLAEILGSITGLEYAYTKAPANMRSLVFGESFSSVRRGWASTNREQACTTSPQHSQQQLDKPSSGWPRTHCS